MTARSPWLALTVGAGALVLLCDGSSSGNQEDPPSVAAAATPATAHSAPTDPGSLRPSASSEAALLGTWTDGNNGFEFRPDGTVTFTSRSSCTGSFDIRGDVLSVDFGDCAADSVQLSAPMFRNAVVRPASSGETIVLEGDAGRFQLSRTD